MHATLKGEVDKSKRLWNIVSQRYHIWRTIAQWTIVGKIINWLTM